MSEDFRTVSSFHTAAEAEVARNRLEEEGIRVLLSGDMAATALAGVEQIVGGTHVQVPAEDVARARAILDADREAAEARDRAKGIPLTTAGRPAWVCPRCGTHVDQDIELCPSCGTLVPDPAALGDEEDGAEAQDLKTRVGDRLAARAFAAALFGIFICAPLPHLYSLWLLWKLSHSEADVSARGRWMANAACIIDLVIVALAALAVLAILLALLRP
jgi:hypothetical protein